MKILLVDDHQLFLEGVSQILIHYIDGIEVLTASSVSQALELVENTIGIDLALVDLAMPQADGFSFLQQASKVDSTLPVAVLSASENIKTIQQVFNFGAQGFIPKTSPPAELINAIETLLSGEYSVPESLAARLDTSSELNSASCRHESYDITERQFEVLSLLAKGLSNQKIASSLYISEHTVKSHVKQLFLKLDSDCRMDCVNHARELGLLTL